MRFLSKNNIRKRFKAEKAKARSKGDKAPNIEEMAHILGVSKQTFYNWHTLGEPGKGKMPPSDNYCLNCTKTSSDSIVQWINDGTIETYLENNGWK